MESILNIQALEKFRQKEKIQPFRIKQIYYNIFKNSIIDFDQMTDISKSIREKLKENFFILSIKPVQILKQENTTKIMFKTSNKKDFESVIMFHHWKKNEIKKLNRITICLSSQIWCAIWCKFCVTWKLWFIQNLKYNEIIEQILWANNYIKNNLWKKEDGTWFKIRNVVFMWMWEPLLNYENTKKSIDYMIKQEFLSLSKRHVTVSTSWIIPWIEKMIKDNLNVMLAISLHSWNNKTREEIMPINKKYNIKDLIIVLDDYVEKTKNRIFYEYIMIQDKTDTLEEAKYLVKLLKWRFAHVNLIPYNENPQADYKSSTIQQITKFKKYLENNWITTTNRTLMWDNVKWACGQLWYEELRQI